MSTTEIDDNPGNCLIHPSVFFEWVEKFWVCASCVNGEQPESNYGKVLLLVKEAMENAEVNVEYNTPLIEVDVRLAEETTQKILAVFEDQIDSVVTALHLAEKANKLADAIQAQIDRTTPKPKPKITNNRDGVLLVGKSVPGER
jgi:hypothetical protein